MGFGERERERERDLEEDERMKKEGGKKGGWAVEKGCGVE